MVIKCMDVFKLYMINSKRGRNQFWKSVSHNDDYICHNNTHNMQKKMDDL